MHFLLPISTKFKPNIKLTSFNIVELVSSYSQQTVIFNHYLVLGEKNSSFLSSRMEQRKTTDSVSHLYSSNLLNLAYI